MQDRESQIVSNLELVRARIHDLESSQDQFLQGEDAYKRLESAKQLDRVHNTDVCGSDGFGKPLKLDKKMHADYLREIVESGGSPGI